MKKILKLPLRRMPRRPPPAEPLRAKAAADAGTYDNDDYEAEEEPNMKFSHALIVVLALHIIAVGGVFAFNSIKAGQSASNKASAKDESAPLTAQASSPPKPTPAQQPVDRAGKTHTVQAGDTLGRIASLYKISVEAIEKENGITTYSMIRVGQVLKIPASESSTKPEVARTATDSCKARLSRRQNRRRKAAGCPRQSGRRKTTRNRRQNRRCKTARGHRQGGRPQGGRRETVRERRCDPEARGRATFSKKAGNAGSSGGQRRLCRCQG